MLAAFVPPPPDTLDALLDDLLAYVNGDDHPALVQAIAHVQFETIHPFADGNGRTGSIDVNCLSRLVMLSPPVVRSMIDDGGTPNSSTRCNCLAFQLLVHGDHSRWHQRTQGGRLGDAGDPAD